MSVLCMSIIIVDCLRAKCRHTHTHTHTSYINSPINAAQLPLDNDFVKPRSGRDDSFDSGMNNISLKTIIIKQILIKNY